ncbi:MAG TPA: pyridoxamine 5'-phosphate oxidase family protein [Streptosporangiaceae bacterium]|nr:pyridoxamine 5'-phosphate oxidase family protein [Streptosporangiaceae bacterium]
MATDVLPDAATPFGQRVRARLRSDEVIWIVTVGADGRPQPNPVGFCRDGGAEFVIYSRPDARRLRHLRERPDQVSVGPAVERAFGSIAESARAIRSPCGSRSPGCTPSTRATNADFHAASPLRGRPR